MMGFTSLAVGMGLAAWPGLQHEDRFEGGRARHSSFGAMVAAAGDFDADGVPDLILGEPGGGWDDQPPALWVVSGREASTLCLPSLPRLEPGRFGVHGGVDADGDRIPDILLTATTRNGRAPDSLRVVSGATGAVSMRIHFAGPAWGGEAWAHFIDDLDGDGLADVGALRLREQRFRGELAFFGARSGQRIAGISLQNEGSAACGGFIDTGDVDGDGSRNLAVLLAAGDGTVGTLRLYSLRTGKPLWEHPAPDGSCEAHTPLIRVGDVDADGIGDLAAGFFDRVDVVSGRTGSLLYFLVPEDKRNTHMGFGCALAPLGDVDEDRIGDFAVSMTEVGGQEGSVIGYSGAKGRFLWRTRGFRRDVWHFGRPLVAVGDVDADGVTDLLAGSDARGSGDPGFAAVISGRSGRFLRTLDRYSMDPEAAQGDLHGLAVAHLHETWDSVRATILPWRNPDADR